MRAGPWPDVTAVTAVGPVTESPRITVLLYFPSPTPSAAPRQLARSPLCAPSREPIEFGPIGRGVGRDSRRPQRLSVPAAMHDHGYIIRVPCRVRALRVATFVCQSCTVSLLSGLLTLLSGVHGRKTLRVYPPPVRRPRRTGAGTPTHAWRSARSSRTRTRWASSRS